MLSSWLRGLVVILMVGALAACGGGDAFSGSGSTTTTGSSSSGGTAAPAATMVLLVSSSQLPSDGSSTVTLTARAQDATLNYIQGATIAFAISSGVGGIKVVNATTNESGMATALLDTAGDPTVRNIVVTATDTSSGLSASRTVSVVGTSIAIAGNTSMAQASSVVLTATLKDSGGKGIADKTLTVTSSLGNPIAASTLTTDSTGQIAFTVTGTNAGSDTITVTGLGVSATFALTVAAPGSTNLTLNTSPTAGVTEVNIGASQTVEACLTQTGITYPQTVNFAATRGTLTSLTGVIAASGGCTTTSISSTIAGVASISASTATGLDAVLPLEFIATTPAMITLQAEPAVVASGEKAVILAIVRDANKNLVKNKVVYFSILADPSSGTLSQAWGKTNSAGQVTSVYTAGTVGSGKNEVQIQAQVAGMAVLDMATLTVGNKALHVALGTGNIVNLYGTNNIGRALPYMAIVTDGAGRPVANQRVSLNVWSRSFMSGKHFAVFTSGGGFMYWSNEPNHLQRPAGYTYSDCRNEDVDRDGFLDAGEDISAYDVNHNGAADDPVADGMLNPGNVAVSINSKSLVTGSDGVVEFDLVYPAEYAHWLEVDLEAWVTVEGTESKAVASFWLPGIARDYTDQLTSPPGFYSPFGNEFEWFGTNCQQR